MIIFKKAIPRRSFLRGVGAALALPLLDGMVPALATAADTAAKPVARVGFLYIPNGVIMADWTPAADGAAFEFTPILTPLAPFRDRLVVLSGLSQDGSRHKVPGGETLGDHSVAGATFLTGVYPKKRELGVGTSVDQIVAKEFGKHTQLGSLELSLDSGELIGACEGNTTCAYTNTISWHTATTPMPAENNPRVVFERMFGDSNSTDPAERLARIRRRRSILEVVGEQAGRLVASVGPSDRGKLTEYFDAIRDVERRIDIAEEQSSREMPKLGRPAGVPANFEEHAKLMFDLQVLAYQTDLTRVITFMLGSEQSARTYNEIGIADPHHPLTHHNGDTAKIAKVSEINIYHTKMLAYYLEKLRSTPDGEGSLLDHVSLVYGSSLSDGNVHAHNNLPLLLIPGQTSKIKSGYHLRYPKEKETPMANLHLTLMDRLGIPMENFGDSNGELALLSV
jgi:hypothetical protein